MTANCICDAWTICKYLDILPGPTEDTVGTRITPMLSIRKISVYLKGNTSLQYMFVAGKQVLEQ